MPSLHKFVLSAAALSLIALAPAAWAQTALVIHDGTAGVQDIVTNVSNKLADAGYAVTTSVGLPGGGIAGYQQVWNVSFQPADWLDRTAYISYLNGGGSLFLACEGYTGDIRPRRPATACS